MSGVFVHFQSSFEVIDVKMIQNGLLKATALLKETTYYANLTFLSF